MFETSRTAWTEDEVDTAMMEQAEQDFEAGKGAPIGKVFDAVRAPEPAQPASGEWEQWEVMDAAGGWVVLNGLPTPDPRWRIVARCERKADADRIVADHQQAQRVDAAQRHEREMHEELQFYLGRNETLLERADALEEAVREVRRVAIEGVFKGGYALDDTERLEKVIEITDALSTQNRRDS